MMKQGFLVKRSVACNVQKCHKRIIYAFQVIYVDNAQFHTKIKFY